MANFVWSLVRYPVPKFGTRVLFAFGLGELGSILKRVFRNGFDPIWLVDRLMKSNFGICDTLMVYMGKRRVGPVLLVILPLGGLLFTLWGFLLFWVLRHQL